MLEFTLPVIIKKMLRVLIIYLFVCSSFPLYGQALENYKDIVNLDDDYKILKSNIEELQLIDISHLWLNKKAERIFGFIGSNYRRLHIKFITVNKNIDIPNQYYIYGKSKVSNNICIFKGILNIKESYYYKSSEYPRGDSGILAGDYTFYEDSNSLHAGVFSGRFVTYWYKDKEGKINYNDLWSVSSSFNNNQFKGFWTKYGNNEKKIANWGDDRIPQSGDLDIGTSEFGINEKYRANGWETFLKAYRGGFNEEETERALKEEMKLWWKDK